MSRLDLDQAQFLKEVHRRGCPRPLTKTDGILSFIKNTCRTECISLLEGIGASLKDFVSEVDLEHPDVADLLGGELVSDRPGSFNRLATSVIGLLLEGHRINADLSVMDNVLTPIRMSPVSTEISAKLMPPSLSQRFVRLLPSETMRKVLRRNKKPQAVDRADVSLCSFLSYRRGVNRFERDIKYARRKKDYFASQGLSKMAREVEASIDKMTAEYELGQHYGFNPISLQVAAAILARKKKHSVAEIVPYHLVEHLASATIQGVLEVLENFPDAQNKPIFDHFRVLFAFHDYQHSFTMIDRKLPVPVLLGEKDGQHYFVCYFM